RLPVRRLGAESSGRAAGPELPGGISPRDATALLALRDRWPGAGEARPDAQPAEYGPCRLPAGVIKTWIPSRAAAVGPFPPLRGERQHPASRRLRGPFARQLVRDRFAGRLPAVAALH